MENCKRFRLGDLSLVVLLSRFRGIL